MLATEIYYYNDTIYSMSNWATSFPSINYLPPPLYLTNDDLEIYLLKPKIIISFNKLNKELISRYIYNITKWYDMSSKHIIKTVFTNHNNDNFKIGYISYQYNSSIIINLLKNESYNNEYMNCKDLKLLRIGYLRSYHDVGIMNIRYIKHIIYS